MTADYRERPGRRTGTAIRVAARQALVYNPSAPWHPLVVIWRYLADVGMCRRRRHLRRLVMISAGGHVKLLTRDALLSVLTIQLPEDPLNALPTIRIGMGHDTHRLGRGGVLRLGGIVVDDQRHLIGHSDADVLLHAVTDALLGAIAAGDIGDQFPDTDPANQDRDSAEMLKLAFQQVCQAGYHLQNLDCTVFAEQPKLGSKKWSIRCRLAELLQVPPDRVSLKAKTGERVGPIGRAEAISAQCVVLLSLGDAAPKKSS